ncbi:VOC family protein [Actinocrispum wychmicini]|uniref:Catechol 2,3-dioxygenase-like lactoylglutathione lyase family enzyme n=1 Tax=Actinocrispum wychmicini TaxID=1213861 RepID=A0A4R2JKI4_9PSEU|nr:VOC family protein [Actinocrispum wychmicini]TCO60511.1 catechol 2,3-dioxygenase-like lactoylglutathione lyase family enzyme [Actinocrispum wychmicini]
MATRELAGIHHVKIPVTDLARTAQWYRQVFGLCPTMEFREADGVVRGFVGEIPGLAPTQVAFRVNDVAAAGSRGFDPVSFAVKSRDDLETWVEHLDSLGIEHSPVIEASVGWLLVFDDPDGVTLHLYTWAEHGIDQADKPGYGQAITDPDRWQPI